MYGTSWILPVLGHHSLMCDQVVGSTQSGMPVLLLLLVLELMDAVMDYF